MISPIWFRPAVGQLFRGGVDFRSYHRQIVLYGLFKTRQGDLDPLKGWLETQGVQRFSEKSVLPDDLSNPVWPDRNLSRPAKVLFDRFAFSFKPLNGWNQLLREELRLITRHQFLDFSDGVGVVPIGVNIRCGNDFAPAVGAADFSWVGWLQKTPIAWFVETIQAIRETVGFPVRALVVSDGTRDDLKDILAMENVQFLRPGCAITDLLVLSQSKVLLASASSTFSAWACFLGQMPTANAPGHPLTQWGIEQQHGQFVGDFDPRAPAREFLEQACLALEHC